MFRFPFSTRITGNRKSQIGHKETQSRAHPRRISLEALETRICPSYTFNLTFETPLTGSGDRVLTDFGHPLVPTADGASGIELFGVHSTNVDPDLVAVGFGGTVLQSSILSSQFGTGRIEIKGALGTSITFHYGAQGEINHPSSGGIEAYTYSRSMLSPGADNLGNYLDPTLATSATPEDRFRQFALNQGQPAGPQTLDGPSSGSGYFNSFRWTSGTNVSDPFVNTRPGAIQIDGVSLEVESIYDILTKDRDGDGMPDSFNVESGVFADPLGFIAFAGGPAIKAEFNPVGRNGPINIRDLAQAVGVDYFTWINRIDTELPGTRAVTADGTFTDRGKLRLDPDIDGKGTLIQSYTTGITSRVIYDIVPDLYPYYWNLSALDSFPDRNAPYIDAPSNHVDLYANPNDRRVFRTELVGVRLDQPDKPVGLGVAFTWSTNTKHVGDEEYHSGGINSIAFERTTPLPPDIHILGGGVSDIQFVYGPTPPVAVDDSRGVAVGSSLSIPILANDVLLDFGTFDTASVNITTEPTHGTIAINATSGIATYSPAAGFSGTDTFKYTVRDNKGTLSNEATVAIRIVQPPVAGDDSESTLGTAPVTINVLVNDSDPDGTLDPTSVAIATPPANGTIGVNPATGAFTYVPYAGFTGTDTFGYTVKDADGVASNHAIVTVTIAAVSVLGVTRVSGDTGPLQVAIEFSAALVPGPANDVRNFTVATPAGSGLPLASAVYSEAGGVYRIVLTSAASGPFEYGEYLVRVNGAAVWSLAGPLVGASGDRLLVEVGERNAYVTIRVGAGGQSAVDGGPTSFGTAPPGWIDGADINGDGLYDLVTTSAQTSEVVLFYGQPEGGFGPAKRFTVEVPDDRESRPARAIAYDWDRNGTTDLVIWDNATGLTGQYWGGRFPRVVVYLNDGWGRFSVAPDMPILLPDYVMWQEATLAVGPFAADGSTALALIGPSEPNPVFPPDPYAAKGTIQIIAKDPSVGYSQAAVLPNGQAGWWPTQIASGDFNSDGRPDLAAATGGYFIYQQGITLNLSTPTGYAAAVLPVYDGETGNIAVGDFTGDGKSDLVLVHDNFSNSSGTHDGGTVTVFAWDAASGNLVALGNQVLGRRGVSLVGVADLNADGKLDLVLRADEWAEWGTPELSVLPLYGNGDGTFRQGALSPLAPSGNTSPGNFVIRDVTRDGFPDAVFGNTVGGRTGLLTNDTTGVLRTASPAGPDVGLFTEDTDSTLFEPGLLTGDLNRDGLTDLIRVESGFGIYLAETGGGYRLAGTLPQPTGWTVPQSQWGLLGDLNGDGIPDLVVQAGPFEPSSALAWVWLGNGDGTFRLGPAVAARDVNSGGGARGTLADVNGDGRLDMVVWLPNIGTQSAPNGFAVWFGDGAGKLTYNPNTEVSGLWAGENYFSVVPNVFDATGDGVPDVVTRRVGTAAELAVYPGRGNGTFDTPVLTAGDSGLFFVPLDYNQDGVTDLVRYGTTTGGPVTVLAGIGGGRFAAPVSLGSWSGYRTTRVVVGDFNQDGNPDVAVSLIRWLPGTPETKVLVLNGDGSGGFTTTTLYTGGQHSPRHTGLGGAGDGPEALAESDLIAIPGDGWVEAGSVTPPLPPAPPAPPAGQPLSVTTTQGKPVRVVPPSVPGISQLIAVDAQPAHGVVRIDDNGTPNNPGDDLFIYTPAPGYVGPDAWSYVAGNAGGAVSGEVSVTIAPGPQLRFDSVQYISEYTDANVVMRIIRSGDTSSTASVLLRRTGGTLPAAELSELPDQITFAPGETEKELILSRNRVPVSGTVELALVAPDSTVGLGSPGAATVTFRFPPVSGYAVYGYAFRDRNDDSARDPGEELAGARVYIDANQNGRLDTGETTAFSDADGFFLLDLPIPGTFTVFAFHPDSQHRPSGYTITAYLPGSGFRWDIGFPDSSFPPPNTLPTISDIPDLTLAPGAISGTVGFTVGDAETPANFLQVTAKSDNPALVPGVTITGSGGNKTVLVVPTYGQSGTAVVTVTVRDEGGLTATDSFVVTVPPAVNDPPKLSDVADRTIGAGMSSGPIPFTVNDLQTPSSGLTVTARSDNAVLVSVSGLVLGGFGPNRTLTVIPAAGATGSAIITLSVTDAGGLTTTDTFTVTVLEPPPVPPIVPPVVPPAVPPVVPPTVPPTVPPIVPPVIPPVVPPTIPPVIPPAVPPNVPPDGGGPIAVVPREFAVGADRGSGVVQLYNPDGSLQFATSPFSRGFSGGVRVAAADFNGDGVADVVAGTGPGRTTRVVVLHGRTQQELFAIDPFEPGFTGGVYVAAGDVTGDGVADLVITPDEGGGPRVRVFSGAGFGLFADFFGIDDPNFRGGARAAVGDVNGDGVSDLLVAAGFGGGPRVAGFDGRSLGGTRTRVFGDFFAFETGLRNGVFLSAGDLDGDGKAELVAGGGPGGGPRVSTFSGAALLAGNQVRTADYFAGDTANRGGVRVAVKDLDGDDRADLVTGAGFAAGSRLTAYAGKSIPTDGTPPELYAFDAFDGFANGIYVG